MRHQKARLQFNRFTSWRKATLQSLARSILIYQSIKTTETRAKAARSLVEKLITLAKQNTLTARRSAFKYLQDHALVKKLFDEIGPRFSGRTGGYTRILHFGQRRGDGASLVIFELTEIKKPAKKAKKGKDAAHGRDTHDAHAKSSGHEAVSPKEPSVTAEKPAQDKKTPKKFLGNLRSIFKKERES
jgi:large subunit ribosomal protein L17